MSQTNNSFTQQEHNFKCPLSCEHPNQHQHQHGIERFELNFSRIDTPATARLLRSMMVLYTQHTYIVSLSSHPPQYILLYQLGRTYK